ncbi:MAG TPA: hypothetical protein VF510_05660 [Ktedonobacterales bacterium]
MSATQGRNSGKGTTTSSPKRTLTTRTQLATLAQRIRAATAGGRLRGRTLLFARAAWLVLAAVAVALYVASVLLQVRQLQAPCQVSRSAPITAFPRTVPVCPEGQVPLAVARALADLHLSIGFVGWYALGIDVLFVAGYAAIAAILFWRRSHDLLALYISLALLIFACLSFHTGLRARLVAESPGWRLPVELLQYVGAAAFVALGFVFPDGRFVPRWTRWAAPAFALWFLPVYFFAGSALDFDTWPAPAFFGWGAVFMGAMGAAQVYRYRHISSPTQRLQTKWVVFGILAAGTGFVGGKLVELLAPVPTSPGAVLVVPAGNTLIHVGFLLFPLTVGIAILRHRLFDIDLIIKQTLIYTLLAATLALLYESSALALEKVLLTFTGQESLVAAVAVAFGVGALAEPLHHRIKRDITRIFYPRKYEAEHRIEAYSQQVRHEMALTTVPERVEAAVETRLRLARPDHTNHTGPAASVPHQPHERADLEEPAARTEPATVWAEPAEPAPIGSPSPLPPHPIPPP